jgi:hypothetical protein
VPQLIQQIVHKASKWKVAIQWVPCHTNIAGNEIADNLAKADISETRIISNSILLSDAFCLFKEKSVSNTNLWYREYSTEKGETFFQFQ